MRVIACGLIVGAALLGAAPVATADESTPNTVGAAPQAQVSMLAVALTIGGAVATVGSGAALALARRRKA